MAKIKQAFVEGKKSEFRFEIKTPSASFTGERCGVKFRDGVGYTDDEKAAEALAELGYSVADQDEVIENGCYRVHGDATALAKARNIGVQLVGNYGLTSDSKKAHACQEFGCKVIDVATGAEAWPSVAAEAQAPESQKQVAPTPPAGRGKP